MKKTIRNRKPKLVIKLSIIVVLTIFIGNLALKLNLLPTKKLIKVEAGTSTFKKTNLTFSQTANHYLKTHSQTSQLPLYLQKDERWSDEFYGRDRKTDTFGLNGCAPTALAMIASYWEQREVLPTEILGWAGNQFFVPGQGTSWSIFQAYAEDFGYNYQIVSTIDAAQIEINQGRPVIVSVLPGTFTTTGHLLVLSANQDGELLAYDPNDDSSKNHYQETFSPAIFEAEALNYWVLSR